MPSLNKPNPSAPSARNPADRRTPAVRRVPEPDTFAQTTLGSMYPLRLAGHDDEPTPARAPGTPPRQPAPTRPGVAPN